MWWKKDYENIGWNFIKLNDWYVEITSHEILTTNLMPLVCRLIKKRDSNKEYQSSSSKESIKGKRNKNSLITLLHLTFLCYFLSIDSDDTIWHTTHKVFSAQYNFRGDKPNNSGLVRPILKVSWSP